MHAAPTKQNKQRYRQCKRSPKHETEKNSRKCQSNKKKTFDYCFCFWFSRQFEMFQIRSSRWIWSMLKTANRDEVELEFKKKREGLECLRFSVAHVFILLPFEFNGQSAFVHCALNGRKRLRSTAFNVVNIHWTVWSIVGPNGQH